MIELNVSIDIPFEVPATARAQELIGLFGLQETRIRENALHRECRLKLLNGDIVYITGASGTGKTVLLNALYEATPPPLRLRLDTITLETDRPLIDCFDTSVLSTAETLSKVGLSDVFCMLHPPAHLSVGQQYRYRMAQALAANAKYIFADEFTGSLDRITAAATAFRMQKFAKRSNKIFVLAGCHEDVPADLQPDILIVTRSNGKTETLYKDKSRDPKYRFKI